MALFQGFNVKIPPYHQGSLCPQRRYCGLFILYVEENPLCSGGNSGNLPRNNPTTLHRLKVSTELLVIHGGSVVMAGNGNWVGSGSMDQITVVRIGDTHIAGEELHVEGKVKGGVPEYQNMEYSMPTEDEGVAVEEEEEDSVYVIEYSNPEEEGESYQFTMSVDRSLPTKRQIVKDPLVREDSRARVPSRPKRLSQSMKLLAEEGVKQEQVVSNKSVLELGEDYRNVMEINSGSGKRQLVCSLCPPGRFFKRPSGLAVHLRHLHQLDGKKTYYCTSCKQTLRSQIKMDAHTRRHANQNAVFTCFLCLGETENKSGNTGYQGSKWGLRKHMEKEHPGIIPPCHICHKNFKTVPSYLADQFRHVGVSPYYCAKCQIYEMTERGLSVHIKNHNKKQENKHAMGNNQLLTPPVFINADNSATDDSDF
ncbi:myoneurin-like isoform X1 [Mugil cephalus]|uniref:myoneurin-like isoform X1 n=1 Tax=Mugil cephalus TaxID=48193 RepID=UPI001FB79EDD|nr:myoneurin-like isoform X1 [Mugil cephalus]